ncbi:MAG TPA: ABC transporter permease [Kribbella sp.]|jgi:ribose transport system permease protein
MSSPRHELLVNKTTRHPFRVPAADALFVPAVLAILFVYLSATSEYFLTTGNIQNILLQASILALISFGVTSIIIAGELDLSVGTGMALVSVVTAMVAKSSGSVLTGLLVGILVGLLIGVVNGLVVTQLEVPSFVATLGMMVIAQGAALALSDGAVIAGLPVGVSQFNDIRILGFHPLVIAMFVYFAVLLFIEKKTVFGVRVFAVGGNSKAARLSGVPVSAVRLGCFLIGGLSVGLAGVALTLRVESGQPNSGSLTALMAVAAIVIGGTSILGGKGSVGRTLAGVALIAVLENGLDLKGVDPDMQQVTIGVVFIVAASTDFFRRQLTKRNRLKSALSARTN